MVRYYFNNTRLRPPKRNITKERKAEDKISEKNLHTF
jgi:hypothetical protein